VSSRPCDMSTCERCGRIRNISGRNRALCIDCHKVPAPRPAPPKADVLAGYSIRRATQLACLVRDEGRDGIGDFLDALTMQQLYGMCVALAAMVPDDRPVDDLLAWVRQGDGRLGDVVPEVSAA
jgi:hypothetical protein